MTPLEEIAARANAATQGPWTCEPLDGLASPSTPWSVFCHEADDAGEYPSVTDDDGNLVLTKANAVFVAHAREDVPKLVGALLEVAALHASSPGHNPLCECGIPPGDGATCTECGHDFPCPTISTIQKVGNG